MSMRYHDALKDPRWQKKRLEVMSAHKWTCQTCGDDKNTLHVHHPKYEPGRAPWEYDNLVCLCEACHSKVHDKSTAWRSWTDPGDMGAMLLKRVRQALRQPENFKVKRLAWEEALNCAHLMGVEITDEDRGLFLTK